jgi:pimeloyl-ACP methyl ester carboxylesterase
METIPDAAHLAFVDDPDAAGQAVRRFLRKVAE